ncbi:MAG: PD-(D/E)XK nuclease family protein [Burkholderiaceae bacterium]
MDEIAAPNETGIAPGHPVMQLWLAPGEGVVPRIEAAMAAAGAHPARTVVLVPYAHLMHHGRLMWMRHARAAGTGAAFLPRFETTMNWTRSLGAPPPGADDLSGDAARDILTAQARVEAEGLGARRDLLAGRVLEAARQLAPAASALPPDERGAWAAQARPRISAGMEMAVAAFEAAVAHVALDWAAASSYATDVLFDPALAAGFDLLVVLEGLQPDALAQALVARHAGKTLVLPLRQDAPRGAVALHEARDAEDEAQRAAACVVRHIAAGRVPVALADTDRSLTRRIRAMLETRGAVVRDETGWKLSTTRSAAGAMAALRACAWDASGDAVLDWLKNSPSFATPEVSALERWLRRQGVREWRALGTLEGIEAPFVFGTAQRANELREAMAGTRPLAQWLASLRELLQACGQWDALLADAAGEKVVAALRLEEGAQAELSRSLAQSAMARGLMRRIGLAEFTAWVNEVLESANFTPVHPREEQVVVLPFSQVLARPFAALVLPGCDEQRLPASPEPDPAWTPSQREALGLPSRDAVAAGVRAAWATALQVPQADVLWRACDAGGEPILPSPLVQALQLAWPGDSNSVAAEEPRASRPVPLQPVARPAPSGAVLPVSRISASAYEDLRRCPYRFFALRQLGLQEQDELDSEIDKRDFGLWLHAVLKEFHESLLAQPMPHGEERRALLEAAAENVTRTQALDDGEFLPFLAAWPQVRESYLEWLSSHEATGAVFTNAEKDHDQPLGELTLIGKLDRIDTLADGGVFVIDYKTESATTTRERIKRPAEDTQLAFYAALLPHDTLRAAYVNIGEREPTKHFEQEDVVAVRDALVEGIVHDMQRIAAGAPMPALGEGMVCEHCSARGLCRKDFWEAA